MVEADSPAIHPGRPVWCVPPHLRTIQGAGDLLTSLQVGGGGGYVVLVDVFCIVQGLIIKDYVQFQISGRHTTQGGDHAVCLYLPLFEPHVFNA